MTETVRLFVQQIGNEYSSYMELESAVEMSSEVEAYFDQLFEDIIDQAKTGFVSILDVNSELTEEYELDTLEDCLAYCELPDSVMEFAEISNCNYEFIVSLFTIAESHNEVPSFQLAEGTVVCNYISEYRRMSADYEYFKKTVGAELSDLSYAYGQTARECLYDNPVYLYGNNLKEEFFQNFLEDLEKEYESVGISKLAKLYKKADEEIQALNQSEAEGKEGGRTAAASSAKRVSFRELYTSYKRDLIVDILRYAKSKGRCLFNGDDLKNSDLPQNLRKFVELSGCDSREIRNLFLLAAKKAETSQMIYRNFTENIHLLEMDCKGKIEE